MKSYYNVAVYYQRLNLINNCNLYCDSAISIALHTQHPDAIVILRNARLLKLSIYFLKGDFQKYLEESVEGMKAALQQNDSLSYLNFINQKAFALVIQGKFDLALADLHTINILAKKLYATDQASIALKTAAILYNTKKDYPRAYSFFRQSIGYSIAAGKYNEVATEYTDWGNLYINRHLYKEAQNCFLKALDNAKKNEDAGQLASIQASMQDCSFKQGKYEETITHCIKAFAYLKLNIADNILLNPAGTALNMVTDKDLILTIMRNKAELLLGLFTKTKDAKYLTASIQTALVTDSLITNMRKGQSGEQSKLFWRDKTRGFYARAMEACFLASDAIHTFFFMEKSRAVLLNDRLAQLGAAAHLPATETAKEQSLQINIIAEQQKLTALNDSSKEYFEQQIKLIEARNEFEQYIQFLEQQYPAYYQYKYADAVPSLHSLQQYLNSNKQSFVHYFISDTAIYILGITGTGAKLVKLSKKDFDVHLLPHFLQFCSSKDSVNNHYPTYAALAFTLYQKLVQPLQLAKGRVIICQDNYFIPFEALCSDALGKQFLLYDYTFSYVYAARSLMLKTGIAIAEKDFFGISPVSFAPYLNLPDLKESADYLQSASGYYPQVKLLMNKEGSKSNFLKNFPGYAVVNIFSHASADTNHAEPYLYMADSVLNLSELALINNPFTQLVVLSACKTNNGKNASGEGIYSLARGFAAAGIPAVAATLWNAEEKPIYIISDFFHKNIAAGMNKDDALQQAKISFIQTSSENLLPYYWGNIIIMGNTEPVKLSTIQHHYWLWLMGIIFGILLLTMLRKKRKGSATV